jgi:peptidoglycan biosynthesis protein MviN/MurJ (putative lipid II flippase)
MLIRTPDSWPPATVAVLAMAVLAVLDLIGAFAAKEAVVRHSPVAAGAGIAAFVLLFWVYASSLQYAELAPVTLGWIVILQVGVVLLDSWRYGSRPSVGGWVAIVTIVAAQGYLLVGGSSGSQPGATDEVRNVTAASAAAHSGG